MIFAEPGKAHPASNFGISSSLSCMYWLHSSFYCMLHFSCVCHPPVSKTDYRDVTCRAPRTWIQSRSINRIAGVLDFIHRPDFNSYKKKEEQTRRFRNWICFRPQVRGDTYSVGSLRKS
jgi:hypothetical protein